jgi:hypothetical protein
MAKTRKYRGGGRSKSKSPKSKSPPKFHLRDRESMLALAHRAMREPNLRHQVLSHDKNNFAYAWKKFNDMRKITGTNKLTPRATQYLLDYLEVIRSGGGDGEDAQDLPDWWPDDEPLGSFNPWHNSNTRDKRIINGDFNYIEGIAELHDQNEEDDE